jgi:tight adherence protein C
MPPVLVAGGLFLILVLAGTFIGIRYWARPAETIDRVKGEVIHQGAVIKERAEAHPSLALRDVLLKLGSMLPANPKDVTIVQRSLIRAGFRQDNALRTLYGSKIACAIILPLIAMFTVGGSDADTTYKAGVTLAAAAMGFFLPNEYVKIVSRRRQKNINKGLPNALDLMVVCVESGLGLDQAILQVAKELQHAHPEISEEFALVNLELKAGKRRVESLRNLVERTNVEELKKLVAVLIQADRFGTGVAQSLRGHADYMRVQARQQAEEKAAKLGVKLVFPIFFCILPALFVVTVGPVIVRIIRDLVPMLQNI